MTGAVRIALPAPPACSVLSCWLEPTYHPCLWCEGPISCTMRVPDRLACGLHLHSWSLKKLSLVPQDRAGPPSSLPLLITLPALLQVISLPEQHPSAHEALKGVRSEYAVRIVGELCIRKDPNPQMKTGQVRQPAYLGSKGSSREGVGGTKGILLLNGAQASACVLARQAGADKAYTLPLMQQHTSCCRGACFSASHLPVALVLQSCVV